MKTKWIAIGLAVMVALVLTGSAVLAHNANSGTPATQSIDTMNQMHEQMMKNVTDPALRQAMDEMHQQHIQDIQNGEGHEMHSHMEGHGMMGDGSVMMGMHSE